MSLIAVPVASAATTAPGDMAGWTRDFVDNFNGALNRNVWGAYESSSPSGTGKLSEYDSGNVAASGGLLSIRTRNAGGNDWRSGGLSSAQGFSATQGKWAVRARFDRAYGIGFAFLLYPKGGGWPPEVDVAEGTAGGPRLMSALHWSSANQVDLRFKYDVDMTQWHTYGVILSNNRLQFTIDGAVWSTMDNSGSPRIPMWLGIQAYAKAPVAGATGEVVGSQTPKDSRIYIDWVAHWRAS